ncbi:MAG: cytidylate kinase [Candidatus Lokiarchaeota archaeon]|nr:cytidylate kinase [Candidatus Lokiarchaeota archaeon]
MNLVIAIAGLHGTGKSVQAKLIAEQFKLKYISIGEIFRELANQKNMDLETFSKYCENNPEIDSELDDLITKKAKEGNCIIDSQLAAWKSGELSDLKIFLTAPLEIRVKRIATRDNFPLEKAKIETIAREQSEKMRYLKSYNINIEDLTIYDVIINTEKWTIDGINEIIKKIIEEFIKNKKGEKNGI